MKEYSLILVGDERDPVRRFQISEKSVRRLMYGAIALVLVFVAATFDYWRVRADNHELADLRVQTVEQSQEMERVRTAVNHMNREMTRLQDLERKVRIIANLPGAAAVGGAEVTERVADGAVEGLVDEGLLPPAGVPIGPAGGLGTDLPDPSIAPGAEAAMSTSQLRAMREIQRFAEELTLSADLRADSLEGLVVQLEDKSSRLNAMPSVWPTRGWMTSRYGARISPFTGRRQHHSGIDIAAKHGNPIYAPARGRVVFVGRKGPLGKTLVIEHGYGVRTLYGHSSEIHVKIGQQVERGELLASVGSSGRSTGPHLHYTVEVRGKTRNPLDYIFD